MTISPDVLSHLIDLFDYLPLSNRNYIVDGNMERSKMIDGLQSKIVKCVGQKTGNFGAFN